MPLTLVYMSSWGARTAVRSDLAVDIHWEEHVALDPNVQRLAKTDNVAVTVTLMPDGQRQALPTWIDTDGEHLLINTEPDRQKSKNELSQRYAGGPYQNPIGPQGRVLLKIAADRELTAAALFGGG